MQGWLKVHDQWGVWVQKTLRRLVEIVPLGDHNMREVWTAYLPHALQVVEIPKAYDMEDRLPLLHRIGWCEHNLGRYKDAELALRKLLIRREEVLGEEHPATLSIQCFLALEPSVQGNTKRQRGCIGSV